MRRVAGLWPDSQTAGHSPLPLTRPRPPPGSQSACSTGPYGSVVAYRSDAGAVTTQGEAYGVIYGHPLDWGTDWSRPSPNLMTSCS